MIEKVGGALSAQEIISCVTVVREGCAVDPERAELELPRAVTVALVRAGSEIVGVGAIKRPRPNYAALIANAVRSGFVFDTQMNELGYVAVLMVHRGGRSGLIMDSLLGRFSGPLWATTSEELMKHSLSNRGFSQKGKEWLNPEGKRLSLWIKYSTQPTSEH